MSVKRFLSLFSAIIAACAVMLLAACSHDAPVPEDDSFDTEHIRSLESGSISVDDGDAANTVRVTYLPTLYSYEFNGTGVQEYIYDSVVSCGLTDVPDEATCVLPKGDYYVWDEEGAERIVTTVNLTQIIENPVIGEEYTLYFFLNKSGDGVNSDGYMTVERVSRTFTFSGLGKPESFTVEDRGVNGIQIKFSDASSGSSEPYPQYYYIKRRKRRVLYLCEGRERVLGRQRVRARGHRRPLRDRLQAYVYKGVGCARRAARCLCRSNRMHAPSR